MKQPGLRYPVRFFIEGGLLIIYSLILIAAVIRLAWVSFAAPTPVLPQNLPGTLVFNGIWDQGRPCFLCKKDIYRTIPTSFNLHELAAEAGDFYLSPDGTRLSWNRTEGIYITDIESGSTRQIALAGSNQVWSPDSQQLVYKDEGNLVMVNADGSGSQVVLDGRTAPITIDRHTDFSWSHDGTRLVVEDSGSLYILYLVDGHLSQLVEDNGAREPMWSPRGEMIAFLDDGVYVVDSITGELRLLDKGASDFAWSPDGQRLAVSGPHQMSIIELKSDMRTNFRVQPENWWASVDTLVWSPDGRYLAFDSRQCEEKINDPECIRDTAFLVDTWQPTPIPQLLEELESISGPQFSWSPDGQYLAYINEYQLIVTDLINLQPQQVVLDGVRLGCCGSLAWAP